MSTAMSFCRVLVLSAEHVVGPLLVADHVVGVVGRGVLRRVVRPDAGRHGGHRPVDIAVAEINGLVPYPNKYRATVAVSRAAALDQPIRFNTNFTIIRSNGRWLPSTIRESLICGTCRQPMLSGPNTI